MQLNARSMNSCVVVDAIERRCAVLNLIDR